MHVVSQNLRKNKERDKNLYSNYFYLDAHFRKSQGNAGRQACLKQIIHFDENLTVKLWLTALILASVRGLPTSSATRRAKVARRYLLQDFGQDRLPRR